MFKLLQKLQRERESPISQYIVLTAKQPKKHKQKKEKSGGVPQVVASTLQDATGSGSVSGLRSTGRSSMLDKAAYPKAPKAQKFRLD